ncbi:hypothetical protein BX666DRAFT_1946587 [Dichotomocladium elegans]|nr:hypothetical protein BX666DRAFT_1946587 [Dichotomocladium elegans]
MWLSFLILMCIAICLRGAEAQQQQQQQAHDDARYYNVSKPGPNSLYVTGQKLPLVYRISAESTASTLQLSIILQDTQNATNSIVMVQNANIAKGFSEQVNQGGQTVYEHQENYDIPSNTAPGYYNVVYTNQATNHNISIPITIAAANTAITPSPSASTTGSKKSMWSSGALTQRSLTPYTLVSLLWAALTACAI